MVTLTFDLAQQSGQIVCGSVLQLIKWNRCIFFCYISASHCFNSVSI